MVPRSQGRTPGRHGTFRDSIDRLPDVAAMGFDVVYLTPIHPIGTTNRKGRNNAVAAAEGDPGSPYAIGSAEGAAYMSGLPINRAKLAAFTLGGFFAGCAGLYLAIQTGSGNADIPQAGAYTLNSIAAVVLGGVSLMGGVGSVVGALIGALIIRALSFYFRILSIDPLLQPLVEGIVLLAAVSLGAIRTLRVKNRLELFR